MQQHEIREIPEYLLESVVGGDHWCRENNIADSIGDESWSMLPDNISNYYSTGDQGISSTSWQPFQMSQGTCVTIVSAAGVLAGGAVGGLAGATATNGIGFFPGANLGMRFGRAAGFAAAAYLCQR